MSERARRRLGAVRNQGGFTIIELMIATAVLVIFATGTYMAILASINLSKTARETSIATAELECILEEINNTPFINLAASFPGSAPRPSGQSVEIPPPCYNVNPALDTSIPAYRNRNLEDERVWVEYPSPGTDPLEIRVCIWWRTHRGTHREVTMTTVRTNV